MANIPETYSSAPEVCNSTAPEVSSSVDPEVYHQSPYTEWNGLDKTQVSYFEDSPGTICGLKRKTFWIALICIVTVITAGVCGGLVGSRKEGVSSRTQTSNSSPTPTSKSGDSNVVLFGATGTATAATSSSTATSRAQPMIGSNYAVVNWNKTFVIFYQDNEAMIRMAGLDFVLEPGNILNYTWAKPTDPLIQYRNVRNGTSISAVSFLRGVSRREARVYLINTDNILEEWEWNSAATEWTINLIGSGITVSPNSKVTATVVSTDTIFQIYVFYQDSNNRLAGVVYTHDVGWDTALDFSGTVAADWLLLNTLGSGLAVVNYPDIIPTGVRIYYQDVDNKLNWFQGKNTNLAAAKQSWAIGTQLETLPSNTPLSAIGVPTLNDRMLQLFYIQNSSLVADTFNASGIAASSGASETSGYLGSGGIAANGPGVAAISWDEMVLVVTGEKKWFSIWQYTPWDGKWGNPGVPTGYFGT